MASLDIISEKSKALIKNLDVVIKGQEKVKILVLVSLFSGGHVLLEGVPGTGKTLLSIALAKLLNCKFKRIQFTPDLMPTDIIGTNIFNLKTREFEFHSGPIFTDILLADEINRTPPKTQSALLEAMQERNVTIDGKSMPISPIFTTFATQNPVEFEGTYPLPEAQRDRFLLKITIDYPDKDSENEMLKAYASGNKLHDIAVNNLNSVMSVDELIECRKVISEKVHVEDSVQQYILGIIRETRKNDSVQIGAGPRASLALLESSRTLAAIEGRDFVSPDDIKTMAVPVLTHRISISPEAEMEGVLLEDILKQIFEKVEVPR